MHFFECEWDISQTEVSWTFVIGYHMWLKKNITLFMYTYMHSCVFGGERKKQIDIPSVYLFSYF